MSNKGNMETKADVFWNKLFDKLVRLRWPSLPSNNPEPPAYSEHVGVDRDRRHPEAERKDYGRRLRSDARERKKFPARSSHAHMSKSFERVSAVLLLDFFERAQDRLRLLVRQAGSRNLFGKVCRTERSNLFPATIFRAEPIESWERSRVRRMLA
jgi:hypothetical protein